MTCFSGAVAAAASPPSADVVLLIDQSCSMIEGAKPWSKLKPLFNPSACKLPKGNRYLLHSFPGSDGGSTLGDGGWLESNRACAALYSMKPSGQTTPMFSALQSVLRRLAATSSDTTPHVVLVTDGYPDLSGEPLPISPFVAEVCKQTTAELSARAVQLGVVTHGGYVGPQSLLPLRKEGRAFGCNDGGCVYPQKLSDLCSEDDAGYRFPRFVTSVAQMVALRELASDAGARGGCGLCPSMRLSILEYQTVQGGDGGLSFLRRLVSDELGTSHRVEERDLGGALTRELKTRVSRWLRAPSAQGECAREVVCGSEYCEASFASREAALTAANVERCCSADESGACCTYCAPDAGDDGVLGRESDAGVGTECTDASGWSEVAALGNDEQFFCSGVLVAPDVILTARHCLPITRVLLGASLRDAERIIAVIGTAVPERQDADVALLRLARPVEVSVGQRRLRREPSQRLFFHVGYGALDANGRVGFGTRHVVTMPASESECDARRARRTGCVPGLELVVEASGGRDTCDGDSGGALFELQVGDLKPDGGNARCPALLAGVTSRPVHAARVRCGAGGIYTKTEVLEQWIAGVLTRWKGSQR